MGSTARRHSWPHVLRVSIHFLDRDASYRKAFIQERPRRGGSRAQKGSPPVILDPYHITIKEHKKQARIALLTDDDVSKKRQRSATMSSISEEGRTHKLLRTLRNLGKAIRGTLGWTP